MALNRVSSSDFSDVLFEGSLEVFSSDERKMKNFHGSSSPQFARVEALLKSIEDCYSGHHEGDGKCGGLTMRIGEAVQKLKEELKSIEDKVAGNNIGGFGNPAQHVSTFYKSATGGAVEVVPAPDFGSVAPYNPTSLVAVTNTALEMVKFTKKKTRHRDRKSKKPLVPVVYLKSEEDGKMPDDGHCWRKYGSKSIKTAIYKKAYYRCNAPCARNKNKKCLAKKTVQQANNDPTVLHVAYDAPHSCQLPSEEQSCRSQDELGKAENLNLADQIRSNVNAGLMSPVPGADWGEARLGQFNLLGTSSGNFSVISEEVTEGPAFGNLKGTELGNVDSGEYNDLSDLTELGWSCELDVSKCPYVDVDQNKLLMVHIVQGGQSMAELPEQGSPHRSTYMSHIQDWHPYGHRIFE